MSIQHDEDNGIVAEVAAWMERLAAEPLQLPPAPDPAFIWMKAQMLKHWEAQRQAIAPIDLGESLQVAFGAAGSFVVLVLFSWRGGVLLISSGPSLAIGIVISLVLLVSAVIVAFPVATARRPLPPSPQIR
jgi:hypothetical protein